MKWYLNVLKKYADFSGRARRKEFWMFVLFNIIALFALGVVAVPLAFLVAGPAHWMGLSPEETSPIVWLALVSIYGAAMLLPGLSVLVRRLHDTGRSGWWWLICLIPLAGPIWLLVLLCTGSRPGENKYGPNPVETPQPAVRPGMRGASVALLVGSIFWFLSIIAENILLYFGIFGHHRDFGNPHVVLGQVLLVLLPVLLFVAALNLLPCKDKIKTASVLMLIVAGIWLVQDLRMLSGMFGFPQPFSLEMLLSILMIAVPVGMGLLSLAMTGKMCMKPGALVTTIGACVWIVTIFNTTYLSTMFGNPVTAASHPYTVMVPIGLILLSAVMCDRAGSDK